MRLLGQGHPAIRATHEKTLEISAASSITERATCVVAVGGHGVDEAMAGDVRVTVRAGGESFAFDARANSSWEPGGTAVIRRSALRLPGTFATHASAAASDLPRALVDQLRDPATRVEIDVEPIRGRRCVVLFALDPTRAHDPRLAAERGAADVEVAEDDEAARALGVRTTRGSVDVAGRVLVVAARDLPGRTVTDALREVEVEAVGLPPGLAAAAASPSRAPAFLAPDGMQAMQALRAAPAVSRAVLCVAAEQLAALGRLAASLRGTAEAVVVRPYAPPVRRDLTAWTDAGKGIAYVCFDASAETDSVDAGARASVDTLLADGVPTKTVAAVLAALTGWERRRAYDAVLRWPRPRD